MQIPSIPPPIVTNALSQDVINRAVPNIQAAQPLTQNAVAPTHKPDKSNQSRNNKDKGRGESQKERDGSPEDKNEHSVNLSV